MGDWTAIDDLIRRASDPAASAESLREAIGPIFARIERQIAPDAIAFVAACLQAAQDDPSPTPNEGDALGPAAEPNDPPDPVEHQGKRIAALMPRGAQSF